MILTLILKFSLLTGLATILYQDVRERAVWWFLFPVFTVIAGYLHFKESLSELFLLRVVFNIGAIALIFLFSFFYAQLKMKINFFKEAIGLGDILFFFGLSVAFPTEAFVVILVFSMIFSLGLHAFVSRKQKDQTIPLAGYSSLFLIFIYLSNWFGLYKNLYFIG